MIEGAFIRRMLGGPGFEVNRRDVDREARDVSGTGHGEQQRLIQGAHKGCNS
jgi:hypothetical protein